MILSNILFSLIVNPINVLRAKGQDGIMCPQVQLTTDHMVKTQVKLIYLLHD